MGSTKMGNELNLVKSLDSGHLANQFTGIKLTSIDGYPQDVVLSEKTII